MRSNPPARGLSLWKLALVAFAILVPSALAGGGATEQTNRSAPLPISALDLNGKWIRPLERKAKGVVFLFVSIDCPISNRYAPELQRLAARFQSLGIEFWLVYPNADEEASAVAKHRADFHFSIPALTDPTHRLVQLSGARVTPEAAVFSANHQLVYRGRIDNRFPALGKERLQITEHDLEQVLVEIARDAPVPFHETAAVGCSIP